MLGREGKSGAAEADVVEVAGLAAEGVVVVIAVDATGLPAVGADDNAIPPVAPALSHGFGGDADAMS